MPFQTDLMALLPVEDRDPTVARAKQVMSIWWPAALSSLWGTETGRSHGAPPLT
jgi:hypothetical protein